MTGTEGKILASKYAREQKIPYFGLCLGMQIAVIDYARNVLGLEKANSTEFDSNTPHPVIHIMDDQKTVTDKGATMRLGACPCRLKAGSALTTKRKYRKGIDTVLNSTMITEILRLRD